MARRLPRPRRAELVDEAYLAFVRTLACCAPGCTHRGPCDPHHRPGAGMGLKSPDDEAIPLCRRHHRDVDEFRGPFAGMTREQRQEWHTARLAETRAMWDATRIARAGIP